jgi:hypothetical protein
MYTYIVVICGQIFDHATQHRGDLIPVASSLGYLPARSSKGRSDHGLRPGNMWSGLRPKNELGRIYALVRTWYICMYMHTDTHAHIPIQILHWRDGYNATCIHHSADTGHAHTTNTLYKLGARLTSYGPVCSHREICNGMRWPLLQDPMWEGHENETICPLCMYGYVLPSSPTDEEGSVMEYCALLPPEFYPCPWNIPPTNASTLGGPPRAVCLGSSLCVCAYIYIYIYIYIYTYIYIYISMYERVLVCVSVYQYVCASGTELESMLFQT